RVVLHLDVEPLRRTGSEQLRPRLAVARRVVDAVPDDSAGGGLRDQRVGAIVGWVVAGQLPDGDGDQPVELGALTELTTAAVDRLQPVHAMVGTETTHRPGVGVQARHAGPAVPAPGDPSDAARGPVDVDGDLAEL